MSSEAAFTLYYFPIKAKGFGVALLAEFSGLKWEGPKSIGWNSRESWGELKASGECAFGQMPFLKTKSGKNICQTTAIVNYIAKITGPKLEGNTEDDWVMSQMLIAEGEDLYGNLQKYQPTKYVKLGQPGKVKANLEMHKEWWSDWVPKQMSLLEKLLAERLHFTSTGYTAGEIILFSYLHQMVSVQPHDILKETPHLNAWYRSMLENECTQKVMTGASNFGTVDDYFVKPE